MPDNPTLSALFKLTPAEAVAYLQGRGQITPTFSWQDLWQDEHAHQFTVSRLARLDILESLRDGITASVQGDLSRRDWTKNARELLQQEGWWGVKEVLEPSPSGRGQGEGAGKPLTTRFNPARLKLIYDTNTRMAYAAGQWQRIVRNKATHPYVRYITKRDEKVRHSHRAWDNLTLPVDHPFWKTHFPPNGWRCRCRAVSMSQAEYDKGLSPNGQALNKTAPEIKMRDWVNKRTGEVTRVPQGIDPGFAYNPGMAQMRVANLLNVASNKLEAASAAVATPTIRELVASEAFKIWFAHPEGSFPMVQISAADAALIGAQHTVGKMSADTAIKQAVEHGEIMAAEYARIQDVVDAGIKIRDGDTSLLYLLVEQEGEIGGYVLVVKATRTGKSTFVTSYRRLSREDAKRDAEISRLIAKAQKK